MKVIDLEQGSEAWLKYKWRKLGGSTVKHIKSDKRNDVFFNILSQIRRDFDIEDSFVSEAMERGTFLEPEARDYLSDYIGIKLNPQGVWEYSNYFAVSPDGANDDLTIACEIKCPSPKTHTKYIYNDEIPAEHLDQCIALFVANKNLKEVYFISYCPEDLYQQAFIKKIDFNRTFEVKMSRFKTLKDGSIGKTKESYIAVLGLFDLIKDQKDNIDDISKEWEAETIKIKNNI